MSIICECQHHWLDHQHFKALMPTAKCRLCDCSEFQGRKPRVVEDTKTQKAKEVQ